MGRNWPLFSYSAWIIPPLTSFLHHRRESARSGPRRWWRMRRFSRRTAAGWIFDWALCICVWRISHTQVRVCLCVWVSGVRALSSGSLIYFGYLMLLGALGFNYSRAPHLPLPEIYRRETLRFITATPGCVKFQRCRQSAARFATAHLLFDIRVRMGLLHLSIRTPDQLFCTSLWWQYKCQILSG